MRLYMPAISQKMHLCHITQYSPSTSPVQEAVLALLYMFEYRAKYVERRNQWGRICNCLVDQWVDL